MIGASFLLGLILQVTGLAQAQSTTISTATGVDDNGSSQCYYASARALPTSFQPCGDPDVGVTWCCEAGDHCLSNLACFDDQYKTTYLAGCTDDTYSNPNCPTKPGLEDNPWTGLAYCNFTQQPMPANGPWIACNDTSLTVTKGVQCPPGGEGGCSTLSDFAFTASNSLAGYMTLFANGGSSCYPGHASYCVTYSGGASVASTSSTAASTTSAIATTSGSSATSTSVSTSIDSSGGITTTHVLTSYIPVPVPSNIPSSNSTGSPARPTSSSKTGLSSGAEAGIVVGAVVGTIALGAVFCFAAWWKKKRSKNAPSVDDQIRPSSMNDANGLVGNKSELEDPRSPTSSKHWSSGHKSELPAQEQEVRSPAPSYEPYRGPYKSTSVSEMEGSPRIGESAASEAQGSPRRGGPGREVNRGVYEMPGDESYRS